MNSIFYHYSKTIYLPVFLLLSSIPKDIYSQQKFQYSEKKQDKNVNEYLYYEYLQQRDKKVFHGLFEHYIDIFNNDTLRYLSFKNAYFNNGNLNGSYKAGLFEYKLDFQNVRPYVTMIEIPYTGKIHLIEGKFTNHKPTGKWNVLSAFIQNQSIVDTIHYAVVPIENGEINGLIENKDQRNHLYWNLRVKNGVLSGISKILNSENLDDTCRIYFSEGIPVYLACKDTIYLAPENTKSVYQTTPDSAFYYYITSRIPANLPDGEYIKSIISNISSFFITIKPYTKNFPIKNLKDTTEKGISEFIIPFVLLPKDTLLAQEAIFINRSKHRINAIISDLDSAKIIYINLLKSQNTIDNAYKLASINKYGETLKNILMRISILYGEYSSYINREQWIKNMLYDLKSNKEFVVSHKGTLIDGKILIPDSIDFTNWIEAIDTVLTFFSFEMNKHFIEAKLAEKIERQNAFYQINIEKIETLADQIRQLLNSEMSFFFSNSITESYRKTFKTILDRQLNSFISEKDSNTPSEVFNVLECLNEVVEILKKTTMLQSITDNVHNQFHKLEFNPYTNTSITEIQHPRIFKAYREVLIPSVIAILAQSAEEHSCEEFINKHKNIETILRFMLETDDKKLKYFNRRIGRKDNFESLIKKLQIEII